MKKLILLFVLILGISQANAQTAKKRSTGDAEFDKGYLEVMLYARKYNANFKSYIVSKYNVTEAWTTEQLAKFNGVDLMMIIETANNSGKSFNDVSTYFDANRSTKDWEAIFAGLNIKSDSETYTKVKTAVVNNGLK